MLRVVERGKEKSPNLVPRAAAAIQMSSPLLSVGVIKSVKAAGFTAGESSITGTFQVKVCLFVQSISCFGVSVIYHPSSFIANEIPVLADVLRRIRQATVAIFSFGYSQVSPPNKLPDQRRPEPTLCSYTGEFGYVTLATKTDLYSQPLGNGPSLPNTIC